MGLREGRSHYCGDPGLTDCILQTAVQLGELEIQDTGSESEEDHILPRSTIEGPRSSPDPSHCPKHDPRQAGNNQALLRAAHDGLTGRVQHLLKQGADIDFKGPKELTALHHAAFYGFDDTIRVLVDNGADVNAASNGCGTALCIAVARNLSSTVELLLKSRAKVRAPGGCFGSALHIACLLGEGRIIRLLLEAETNLPRRRDVVLRNCGVYLAEPLNDRIPSDAILRKCDPLFCAALAGNNYAAAKLLERAVSVKNVAYVESPLHIGDEVSGKLTFTPIMAAAFFGQASTVNLLLESDSCS